MAPQHPAPLNAASTRAHDDVVVMFRFVVVTSMFCIAVIFGVLIHCVYPVSDAFIWIALGAGSVLLWSLLLFLLGSSIGRSGDPHSKRITLLPVCSTAFFATTVSSGVFMVMVALLFSRGGVKLILYSDLWLVAGVAMLLGAVIMHRVCIPHVRQDALQRVTGLIAAASLLCLIALVPTHVCDVHRLMSSGVLSIFGRMFVLVSTVLLAWMAGLTTVLLFLQEERWTREVAKIMN